MKTTGSSRLAWSIMSCAATALLLGTPATHAQVTVDGETQGTTIQGYSNRSAYTSARPVRRTYRDVFGGESASAQPVAPLKTTESIEEAEPAAETILEFKFSENPIEASTDAWFNLPWPAPVVLSSIAGIPRDRGSDWDWDDDDDDYLTRYRRAGFGLGYRFPYGRRTFSYNEPAQYDWSPERANPVIVGSSNRSQGITTVGYSKWQIDPYSKRRYRVYRPRTYYRSYGSGGSYFYHGYGGYPFYNYGPYGTYYHGSYPWYGSGHTYYSRGGRHSSSYRYHDPFSGRYFNQNGFYHNYYWGGGSSIRYRSGDGWSIRLRF
jgi:hypothetical protein